MSGDDGAGFARDIGVDGAPGHDTGIGGSTSRGAGRDTQVTGDAKMPRTSARHAEGDPDAAPAPARVSRTTSRPGPAGRSGSTRTPGAGTAGLGDD